MFSKFGTIIIIIGFLSMAIMFDWFGARSFFQTGVDSAQVAVDKLEETGDRAQDLMNTITTEGDK